MTNDDTPKKARALGMNHVALEVGDIDEALAFYGDFLEFSLRSRSARAAFIDLGDQFIALSAGRQQGPDDARHLGLVVDDKSVVRDRLEAAGVALLPGNGVDFLDPWGNRIQLVDYQNIQFTKLPEVLATMGAGDVKKTQKALDELAHKFMAPDTAGEDSG
jgi:catechol 2,3-dioxygenase-like lactoylglutathione lyase family enzyme